MPRKTPPTYDDALARMEAKCAAAEHCSAEIRLTLRRMGVERDMAERIVAVLQERSFVDDSRFAHAFVRDKYRFSGWGRYKIRTALMAKSIDTATITAAMEEIDRREYVRNAFRALASRLKQLPDGMSRSDKRQRLLRFGAARGFEISLLVKIAENERLWES